MVRALSAHDYFICPAGWPEPARCGRKPPFPRRIRRV